MVALFILTLSSSYFLKLTPGVMSQGLGGVSVMLDEGLAVFHNPVLAQASKFNFTLSRWFYSTTFFCFGASYQRNSFGISYLNYGGIQGFDEFGNPTGEFVPYDLRIALGRSFSPLGITIQGFQEKIADQPLLGLCCGISSYFKLGCIALGFKVDNLGKEFAQNTDIPVLIALGSKINLPIDLDFLFEVRPLDLEVSSGVLYEYQNIRIFFGAKYLYPEVQDYALTLVDFDFSGGVLVKVDDYEIGYSLVYNEFSTAHQFSIIFTP